MTLLLGLDFGTGGVRAGLYDLHSHKLVLVAEAHNTASDSHTRCTHAFIWSWHHKDDNRKVNGLDESAGQVCILQAAKFTFA